MHYLLLGTDIALKDDHLAQIKKSVFKDNDALSLDLEIIDSHKLSPERLKIALLSLPAMAAQRLIHIRQAERLSKENLELIGTFLKEGHENAVLVLDAREWDAKAGVKKDIFLHVTTIGRGPDEEANTFDMMNSLAAGKITDALKVLKELLDKEVKPDWILGGIVWAWSNKLKARVSQDRYKKGLLVLQEADNHLKRSRYPERGYALEVLLVKLSLLVPSSKV